MSVLRIEGLTKRYRSIIAVNKLDLEVPQGSVFGILGPNGSGKTTTLGIILDIIRQDSGSYTWFEGRYGNRARLKIGALLETPNFYPYLNAVDNLKIIAHIKRVGYERFDELLELVNLHHRRFSNFRTYSLGMKQRLAIAAALVGDPDVLIFDEPTNGLDPQGIAEVRSTILQIAATGKTILMASHILDEVEKTCSHVGIIKNGQLLASGTVGAILSDDITIEIGADQPLESLKALIVNHPLINRIEEGNGRLILNASADLSTTSLNQLAFEHGITLNHLQARQKSLEAEFLEITQ
ncbi:MAG: ATP-binding cassette domain-containing protein [Phaeodactylibacter sp.]|nr:ATP-binding cassette domain-containing protein [Phaeodactylibacter sp.]